MPKGISIHVGVNEVRSEVFSAPPLKHCEDDAIAMFQLATYAGFTPVLSPATGKREPLLGKDATFDNVVKAIQDAAGELKAGETFLFTFAGHGSQEVTTDLLDDPDGRDETIVLVDHLLLNNFWRSDLWPRFKPGVRAIAVADCCHGGGVFLILHLLTETLSLSETQNASVSTQVQTLSRLLGRTSQVLNLRKSAGGSRVFFPQTFSSPTIGNLVVRKISDDARQKELDAFKDFYDNQLAPPTSPIVCSRILMSACEEGEDAVEGEHHGAFTQALLDVWKEGAFENYQDFITQIRSKFSGTIQHPDIKPDPLPDFSRERPFTI